MVTWNSLLFSLPWEAACDLNTVVSILEDSQGAFLFSPCEDRLLPGMLYLTVDTAFVFFYGESVNVKSSITGQLCWL